MIGQTWTCGFCNESQEITETGIEHICKDGRGMTLLSLEDLRIRKEWDNQKYKSFTRRNGGKFPSLDSITVQDLLDGFKKIYCTHE